LEENASISVHLHQRPRAKRSSIEKKKTSAIAVEIKELRDLSPHSKEKKSGFTYLLYDID